MSTLKEIEAIKGMAKSEEVYLLHPKYVKELNKYIVDDFKKSRVRLGNNTIGAMIVCDSSKQARGVFEELKNYDELSKALILHDEDDKETRRQERDDFKKEK